MSKGRFSIGLALAAAGILAVGLYLGLGSLPSTNDDGSERAATNIAAPADSDITPETRAIDGVSLSSGAPRTERAVLDLPFGLVSPTTFPSVRFRPEEYSLERMQIFSRFWNAGQSEWNRDRLADALDRVEELSGEESYQVYVYLRTCLDVPRDFARVDDQLGRIEEALSTNPNAINAHRLDEFFARMDRAIDRCGFSVDDLEPMAMDWLTRAAERGYPLAQIAYYRSVPWMMLRKTWLVFDGDSRFEQYFRYAPQFLQSSLETGHPEALAEVAIAYNDGSVLVRNPQAALAYALASQIASGTAFDLTLDLRNALLEELGAQALDVATEQAEVICERYC